MILFRAGWVALALAGCSPADSGPAPDSAGSGSTTDSAGTEPTCTHTFCDSFDDRGATDVSGDWTSADSAGGSIALDGTDPRSAPQRAVFRLDAAGGTATLTETVDKARSFTFAAAFDLDAPGTSAGYVNLVSLDLVDGNILYVLMYQGDVGTTFGGAVTPLAAAIAPNTWNDLTITYDAAASEARIGWNGDVVKLDQPTKTGGITAVHLGAAAVDSEALSGLGFAFDDVTLDE